ncbi:MAG: DUF952 domain-containing protein [Chloroflexia bacterium]|nr:DUF952 domain-containing protein [Chloroflexia bacterium]MDQ3513194.1 DUF952 domain-containing protein [Chloroflexota bacterium]
MSYLHLVPEPVWLGNDGDTYLPEAFAREGFIHCTIGDGEVVAAANRFYTGDPRPFLVLTLDPAKLTSPVRIEDPRSVFPHIFGPLNVDAVTATRRLERDASGTFLGIAAAEVPTP